ncbi:hypothetical protein BDF22DRAFT_740774 [Syncephalis plumigaleata]|nr:hypothetical protein BDF22DRAFT_740774 [Syncephalis plumigaleata]
MPRVVKCYATISAILVTSRRRLFTRLQSVCGDQHTARSEWRWLEEHTRTTATTYVSTRLLSGITRQIQLKRLRHLLYERIVLRKPLQYILGTQPFLNLELYVRPPTLIPRPETEEWTDRLATLLTNSNNNNNNNDDDDDDRLASQLPEQSCQIVGIDKSMKQFNWLDTITNNIYHFYILLNQPMMTSIASSAVSITSSLMTGYDLIVTNPPYVTGEEYAELDPEVRDWEDQDALVPPRLSTQPVAFDTLGISLYALIIQLAPKLLRPSPSSSHLHPHLFHS